MHRRLISCLLCLCLLLGMGPHGKIFADSVQTAAATNGSEAPVTSVADSGTDVAWEILSGNTLRIYGSGDMADYSSGGTPWFSLRESITAVVVESGVTSIGSYAFAGLTKVQTVSLPEGITRLGQAAFTSCTALERIRIPEGVTSLPAHLFIDCNALKEVDLPGSLTTIEERAFAYCTALQTLDLPAGLTELGKDALMYSGLVSISLPDQITSLNGTFRGCAALTDVKLPDQLADMQNLFDGCSALTQLTIPASVKNIYDYTVQDCPNLSRIIFLGDVPQIELSAFYNVTAECYFPEGNATWLDTAVLKNYGGSLTYFSADPANICDEHSFGQWETVKPNQCVFYGIKGRLCQNCSARELGPIPSSGHYFSRLTTPAGADTVGYTTDTCIYCGYREVTMNDAGNLTYSDAVLYMQDAMARRQSSVTVCYWDTVPGSNEEAKALLNAALVHNGVPTYGDYLAGHLSTFSYMGGVSRTEGDRYLNTATFNIFYRSTAQQEQQIDCWLTQAYASLELEGCSDFEKVKRIHDYIVDRVTYDGSFSRYSVYLALADGYTVCHGYALLTYRLLLMAGLDCRYISGDAGGAHAWVIVKLDGLYYHVDTTWDDPLFGVPNYNYFLKGLDSFCADHTRDPAYDTAEFHAAYPCSTTDYCIGFGSCGEDASWMLYPDGTLVLSGSGTATAPFEWLSLDSRVKAVRVEEGITQLQDRLFFGMTALERIDFMGDLPQMGSLGISTPVDACYPAQNATWQGADLNDHGGLVTWKGYLEQGECGQNIRWELLDDGTLRFCGTGPMELGEYLAPWLVDYQDRIKSVIIGEGITSIGDSAFLECSELVSVSFPENLKELGQSAFQFCFGLTDITFKGNAPLFGLDCFAGVTADAYYSANKATWTEDVRKNYGGILNWIGVEAIRLTALADSVAFVGETVTLRLEAVGEDLHYQWYLGTDGEFAPVGTDAAVLTLDVSIALQNGQVYCMVTNGAGDSATSNTAKIDVYDRLPEASALELAVDYSQIRKLLFTPTADCDYTFTATQAEVMTAHLYEYTGSSLAVADFTTDGFTLTYRLTKGKTYQLNVYPASTEYRDLCFYVTVTRSHGEISQRELEAATCTKNGLTEYTCGLCGQVWTQVVYGDHNYVDGNCSFCGKAQPTAFGKLTDTGYWELTGSQLRLYGTGKLPDFEEFYSVPWYDHQGVILSATVEEGITYIGKNTFIQCSQLTDVSLPDSLVEMGESVFQSCAALREITLPENLQVLPGWSFYRCTKLEEITVPAAVTVIGSYAFYNCVSLKTAVLPDGITDIGDHAFDSCETLTLDKLPKQLETIGERSFAYCYALTELSFPAGVTAIGDNAFCWCDGIETVRFTGNAPQMYSQTFYCVKATAYYPQDDPTWTEEVRSPHIYLQWQASAPERLMGDADGNGTVDGMDATLLLQYAAGWDVQINPEAADVTADGNVDGMDATLLLQYAAGWDVILGTA